MTLEIKAIIVAVLLSLVFWGGCTVQKNQDASEIAALHIDVAKGKTELAEEKQKAAETQLADKKKAEEDLEELRVKSLKEKQDAKKDFDATIVKLRAGDIVVRDKFTCPTNPTSGTPGEVNTGLSREDAEFLLRESERANEVVRLYNEAMDLLDTIYQNQK